MCLKRRALCKEGYHWSRGISRDYRERLWFNREADWKTSRKEPNMASLFSVTFLGTNYAAPPGGFWCTYWRYVFHASLTRCPVTSSTIMFMCVRACIFCAYIQVLYSCSWESGRLRSFSIHSASRSHAQPSTYYSRDSVLPFRRRLPG